MTSRGVDRPDVRALVDQAAQENLRRFIGAHSWRTHLFSMPDRPSSEVEALSRFFFCLLGGYSISYELNALAFNALSNKLNLDRASVLSEEFEASVAQVLKCLPISTAGGTKDVSYRFPNSKAKTLKRAGQWLDAFGLWDLRVLLDTEPMDARRILVSCPGVGYKTASWFLRNMGHGRGIAIIDVHIERIACQWSLIPFGLTANKDYLEIERRIKRHCEAVGCDVGSVDLAIWMLSRGDLVERATGQGKLF